MQPWFYRINLKINNEVGGGVFSKELNLFISFRLPDQQKWQQSTKLRQR